jgi:WD repeat-containing protein 76
MRRFDSELKREANIAQNRVLLKELGIKVAITDLGASLGKPSDKNTAKPVQPTKRIKRERDSESELPRRQSRRLLTKSQSKHETLTPEERVYNFPLSYSLCLIYIIF